MATTYTIGTYKTWVRNKLGDPSFDDLTLTQFAGDVNLLICNSMRWPFMETEFIGVISTSTNSYEPQSDQQQLINFQVTSPTNSIISVDYMPYDEFVQRYPNPSTLTKSQPSIWTTFAGNMIFGPALPDVVYTIKEQYIKYPSAPTDDGATLDVPDDFREIVVIGMYARALEAADQPDYAATQYKLFEQQLAIMKYRYGIRQTGQPMVLQTRRTLLRGRNS